MDLSHVRVKIANGELPAMDWDRTRLVIGGLGPCIVCDLPTTPQDAALACESGGMRAYLHPDCFVMWEEARKLES